MSFLRDFNDMALSFYIAIHNFRIIMGLLGICLWLYFRFKPRDEFDESEGKREG